MRKFHTYSIDDFVLQDKSYLINLYSYVCLYQTVLYVTHKIRFVLFVIMSHNQMYQATSVLMFQIEIHCFSY